MTTTIHRTSMLRSALCKRLTTRMKFIFGKRVRVGKQYAGYRPIEGITLSKGRCTPLYYDRSAKRLVVQVQERPYSIIFLEGDLAVFHSVIYCDCGGSAIGFDTTPRKAIGELLAQKGGEARRSEEEVLCALRGRYCKYPVSLLRSLARMYLYGEDIIIKGGSQNGAY